MESQPQNPEFRINPENFHPCSSHISTSLRLNAVNKNVVIMLKITSSLRWFLEYPQQWILLK